MRMLKQFRDDERGIALILVAIMLPVIIGFALLVIDMSRAENLQNDTQRGADALALAAAAELDGRPDAWTRAQLAIATLVHNDTRFSDGGTVALASNGTVTTNATYSACRSSGNLSWCFLKSIPASDATAISNTNYAATAQETRFIQVKAVPQSFTTIFPASFVGGGNTMTIGSEAVAGFTQSICDITPMFMCNPFEADGQSFQQAFAQGKTYSREFKLLKVDPDPGPGNFGLLQTDLDLRTAFATGSAGTCYLRTSIETKPGVTLGQVNSGLNVRFDIYSGALKQFDTNPAYRPASNVRKGASKSSNCNKFSSATDGSAMGFPPGTDGANYSSAPGMSGDGWDRDGYWNLNHGVGFPNIPSSSHPTSTTMPPSRYDVYRYEITNSLVGDHAGQKQSGETGDPQCFKGDDAVITDDPDRRLFNIAVVDCGADRNAINGHTQLNPDAYARVFLTNPIEKVDPSQDPDSSASEKPIRLEVVDVEGPSGNGSLDKFIRDEVQLYR